ncbi:MAG: hypothetical protein FJY10_03610 [Bacteroidetes bacterium]|nr:hypothetical protein [Bacteroidota bacterium]
MKELFLVRHAKSSWEDVANSDFERPLLEKGIKRMRKVIDVLLEKQVKIDLLITSPAKRTYETSLIIANQFGITEDEIRQEKMLYEGSVADYEDLFYDLSDHINTLMIVGHNPSITMFANRFLERKIDYLPTAGVVGITFKTDQWESVFSSPSEISLIIIPKQLK